MENEELISFNFWPAFADMMLALVLILCLVLFMVSATIAVGTVNLMEVEANQMSMIDSIAADYRVKPRKVADDHYAIYFQDNEYPDIEIHNDLNSQRITFSDNVLFEPDQIDIKKEGQRVLSVFGSRLRNQLSAIREVQIQGHADTIPSKRYESNVELAANRAIAVFSFLQSSVGIKPAEHRVSVTSFGEYQSVQRSSYDFGYSMERLLDDNKSEDLRRRNRRIELVLIYRR